MVRDANPSDARELMALMLEHAAFERAAVSLTEEALDRLLGENLPPSRLLVAGPVGALVGYAAVTFDYSLWRGQRYAHLDCLFVREGARGQGIGLRLLQRAKEVAKSAGVTTFEWQTPDWNTGAIRFYVREGAVAQPKMRFRLDL